MSVGRLRAVFLLCIVPLGVLSGCASSYRLDTTPDEYEPASGVLRPLWSRTLVRQELLSYKPQEWATPAIGADGAVYVGSTAGRFISLDRRGRLRWQVRAKGAISSTPLIDARRNSVYFGADDGRLYAVNASTGKVRWSYATQGIVAHPPAYADGVVIFTSSENRVYALSAEDGRWRWQYDRESPEGFTIQGYAGVLVHDGLAYTGFSDGVLVALKPATGEVAWTRSLAEDAERFFDVDTTPVLLAGMIVCANYATGVYALTPDTGAVTWRFEISGVSALASYAGSTIFASAPKAGLVAIDKQGRQVWQQALQKGVPSAPVTSGRYVMVSSTETGLYVAAARSGDLLERFAPGRGLSGAPGVGAGLLAVLSNYGTLYTFSLQ